MAKGRGGDARAGKELRSAAGYSVMMMQKEPRGERFEGFDRIRLLCGACGWCSRTYLMRWLWLVLCVQDN